MAIKKAKPGEKIPKPKTAVQRSVRDLERATGHWKKVKGRTPPIYEGR